MATIFYVIRHGSNDQVAKSIAGWRPGVHLNEEGRGQAEALAEGLRGVAIGYVYSSPLERARETAEPLARELRLQIQNAHAIGELHFGDWTGKPLDELAQDPRWHEWNRLRSASRIPNGETMLEVQTRFVSFLQDRAQQLPGARVALFSHGDPIRAALLYYLGMPLDFVHRIEISPASVSVVRIGGEPQVLCMNHTGPLARLV